MSRGRPRVKRLIDVVNREFDISSEEGRESLSTFIDEQESLVGAQDDLSVRRFSYAIRSKPTFLEDLPYTESGEIEQRASRNYKKEGGKTEGVEYLNTTIKEIKKEYAEIRRLADMHQDQDADGLLKYFKDLFQHAIDSPKRSQIRFILEAINNGKIYLSLVVDVNTTSEAS